MFWIIKGNQGQEWCKGTLHTPGNDDNMDAYHAEFFAIYCILICLKYIAEAHSIQSGMVKIVCDCLSALTRAVIYNY